VATDYRGRAVGRRLLAKLRDHPGLGGVETVAGTCPRELAPFYESFEFEVLADAVVLNRAVAAPDG
jgi:hypothetical protein